MGIENSVVMAELDQIFTGGENPVNSVWSCVIHAGDKTHKPHKIVSLDIVEDYTNDYSDSITIALSLPKGMYRKIVLDAKYNLVMELKRTPLSESNSLNTETIRVKRYKAIAKRNSNTEIATPSSVVHDSDTMDMLGFETIEFQLIDLAVESIRTYECGGVFRDCKVGDILKYLLTDISTQLPLEASESIKGVEIVKPDNDRIISQTVVPHGVPLYDIPSFLHSLKGVYNSGVGCYLKDSIWYIWPQYRTDRYTTTKETLRIFNLPPNRYPGVERTYRKVGTELTVLSTGESTHLDERIKESLSLGSGVRFGVADKLLNSFASVKGNKAISSRATNSNEFILNDNLTVPYAPVLGDRITNNPYQAVSNLARQKGSIVGLVWESSKVDLVYPGMPVKFHYLKDNQIETVYGVLLKAHHQIYDDAVGPKQHKHKTNTLLTLFING